MRIRLCTIFYIYIFYCMGVYYFFFVYTVYIAFCSLYSLFFAGIYCFLFAIFTFFLSSCQLNLVRDRKTRNHDILAVFIILSPCIMPKFIFVNLFQPLQYNTQKALIVSFEITGVGFLEPKTFLKLRPKPHRKSPVQLTTLGPLTEYKKKTKILRK